MARWVFFCLLMAGLMLLFAGGCAPEVATMEPPSAAAAQQASDARNVKLFLGVILCLLGGGMLFTWGPDDPDELDD